MIKRISSVAVVVSNGKKSAEWYKNSLGFDIKSSDGHWITVGPKSSDFELHLCESKTLESGNTGILFIADDLERTVKELEGNGVKFTKSLRDDGWGKYAMISDPDGNEFWLM
jgi:predicted enzyme related to lactoylglutathione lyase